MRLRSGGQNVGIAPSDAEIVGAPLQTGTFSFTVNVSDSSSPAYAIALPYAIRIKDLSTDYPSAPTRGTVYSWYARPVGGLPPYHWELKQGSLPNGLALNPATGIISGTPLENGDFSFFLNITPAACSAQAAGRWYGMHVNSPTSPSIQIDRRRATRLWASYYNIHFNACCGTGALVFSTTGSLPPGLTLQGQNLAGHPRRRAAIRLKCGRRIRPMRPTTACVSSR